jgi:hypothetical protein
MKALPYSALRWIILDAYFLPIASLIKFWSGRVKPGHYDARQGLWLIKQLIPGLPESEIETVAI